MIRSKIPGVFIRTSLIVGFPGETEDEFEELLEFVKQTRFERLGAFAYSPEEDTPAHTYPNQILEEVREKRGLAYEIRSTLSLFQDAGAFLVSAGVENGKAYYAMQVIMKELEKIAQRGVKASELKRAKDYYIGNLMMLFESTMENMLWHGEKLMYLKTLPSVGDSRRATACSQRSCRAAL